jgi:eukaryotic-like serine/threonine-protein kinase
VRFSEYAQLLVRALAGEVALPTVSEAFGRYEVLRPLATGGMATVYLGRVNAAGGFERLVAIKVMHPHIAGETDFVTMFLDEARLAARIRHPNVVATHDVDQGPQGLFLVMDYVDGPPLHLIVKAAAKKRESVPLDVLLRIFCDVLEGLHAAHELTDENGKSLGLVHRDMSPHNILVGKDGVARLTDFGVAHAQARLTTTRGANLKGKVSYLSPEQVLVGRVDRRSDLFSAGVVLWEALTRRRLFKGETEGQTIAQIIAGARAAPIAYDPSIPRAISDACMRALSASLSDRYQTAIDFADTLEAAARAAGIAIARPRQVGAYLATLEIPPPSLAIPGAPVGSTSRSHGSASAARIASALAGVLPAPATSNPESIPPSATEPSATVGGSLVTSPPTPIHRGWLFGAALALLAAGAALAFLLLPRLRAPAASNAEVAAAAIPPTPPTPVPSASAETQPDAAAARVPESSASAPEPAPTRVAPAAPIAPRRREPKPASTAYKPSEL